MKELVWTGTEWRGKGLSSVTPPVSAVWAPGVETSFSYPVPVGAKFASPTGNDTTGTGTQASPYLTIRKAISVAGANGTVVVRGGDYHEGGPQYTGVRASALGNSITFPANGITVQVYPGETVYLDGAVVVTAWTADTTSVAGRTVWRAPFAQIVDRAPTETKGEASSTWGAFILEEFPIAHWSELIVVDEVQLQQVQTLAEVTTGKFFVEGAPTPGGYANDFTSTAYVIGTNPAGRTVKISNLARAIGCSRANTTLLGIGIRNYNQALCDWGAVYLSDSATGWTMENCDVANHSNLGVANNAPTDSVFRHCRFYRCGQKGLSTGGDRVLVEDNLFEECVNRRYNYGPDAGGIKCGRTHNGIFRRNWFKKTYGHSLWFDQDCYESSAYGNLFTDSYGIGTMVEISDKCIVAYNIYINNGIASDTARRKSYAQYAVEASGSNNTRIWCCTIVNADASIFFGQDPRTPYHTNGYMGADQSWDPRYSLAWHDANCTWNITNGEIGNTAVVGSAGLNAVESTLLRTSDNRAAVYGIPPKPAIGPGVLNNAGNFYCRYDATHPTRAANMWPDGVQLKIYPSANPLTYTGTGLYDPSAAQRWSTMFDETGSASATMTQAQAVANPATYQLAATVTGMVTPAAVPGDIAALQAEVAFIPQTVGAGYLP